MSKCIEVKDNKLIIRNVKLLTEEATKPFLGNRENIEEVIFEEGLECIDKHAFENFPNLKKITFPSTLKRIEENAFYQGACEYEQELEIELNEGLEYIGNYAFTNRVIKEINIPSTVSYIGNGFTSYTYTNKITISKDNKNYSDMGCNVIYDKTTDTLICGCKVSKIPEKTKIIASGAFYCCEDLEMKEIIFPDSLKVIENAAFTQCPLEKITLNEGLEEIGEFAFEKTNLSNIEFPDSLKIIKCDAFSGCKKLSSINLNSNLEKIEEGAFIWCNELKEVIMNCDMKKADLSIFAECDNLKVIYTNNIDKFTVSYWNETHKNEIKFKPITLDVLIDKGISFNKSNKMIKNSIER